MKRPRIQIMLWRHDSSVKFYKVRKVEGYENNGRAYHYKADKRMEYCFTVNEYKMELVNGIPTIGQIEGCETAVTIFGRKDLDAPGENYASLLRTHHHAEGHKTLFEHNFPWAWVVIGIFVIVALVGGFFLIRSYQDNNDTSERIEQEYIPPAPENPN